jgi:hypothetical protein
LRLAERSDALSRKGEGFPSHRLAPGPALSYRAPRRRRGSRSEQGDQDRPHRPPGGAAESVIWTPAFAGVHGGWWIAVFPNHPTTRGFRERKQRPSHLRRSERALISGCVTLPLGSVAWEGRKALRACRGGSGWSGSSRGPATEDREERSSGVPDGGGGVGKRCRSKRGSRAQAARNRVPGGSPPNAKRRAQAARRRASSGSPPKRASAENRRRSGDRLSQARRPSRRRRQ